MRERATYTAAALRTVRFYRQRPSVVCHPSERDCQRPAGMSGDGRELRLVGRLMLCTRAMPGARGMSFGVHRRRRLQPDARISYPRWRVHTVTSIHVCPSHTRRQADRRIRPVLHAAAGAWTVRFSSTQTKTVTVSMLVRDECMVFTGRHWLTMVDYFSQLSTI